MRAPVIPTAFLLSACAGGAPDEASRRVDGHEGDGKLDRAFVIPPNKLVPAGELAEAVRGAGYPCETVTAFSQLELDRRPLDNYRLDCGDHSYLLTWLEKGSRIRPWAERSLGR